MYNVTSAGPHTPHVIPLHVNLHFLNSNCLVVNTRKWTLLDVTQTQQGIRRVQELDVLFSNYPKNTGDQSLHISRDAVFTYQESWCCIRHRKTPPF